MACGAGQMSYPRFLLFDTAGAICWSVQAALIGYFAGKAFANQIWVALVVALGVAGIVALIVIARERRMVAREDAREAAEERATAVSPTPTSTEPGGTT